MITRQITYTIIALGYILGILDHIQLKRYWINYTSKLTN